MKYFQSKYIVLIVFAIIVISKVSYFKTDVKNYGVIDWDNFGYYLYLPAFFIYDDLKIQDKERIVQFQKKYNLSDDFYQAHHFQNGSWVIQYTAGMALVYSPAFFVGHAYAKLSSTQAADGFSTPYQIAVLIESFLLLFIGLFYLRKLCLLFFNDRLSAVLIFLIFMGTNYYHLVSVNISSPHAYLFTAYAVLLYFIYRWHHHPRFNYLLLISIVSALMIFCRPNELLFLIIPFLWRGGRFPTYRSKIQYIFKHIIQFIIAAIPFVLVGIIQPLYWHYTKGEWLVDSYIYEDFKLFSPYLSEFLFSFKKGWLLYTPLMIFALIGFIPFYKKKPFIALPLFIFTLLNIWVLSSWDCWWFADSFGQRSIVQSYPLFVLPLGYLILAFQKTNPFIKKSFYSILVLLFIFNIFQSYQARNGVLNGSRMTKPYYFASLFDVSVHKEKEKLLDPQRGINYIPKYEDVQNRIIYQDNFSNNSDSVTIDGNLIPIEGFLTLTPQAPRSKTFKFAFNDYCDSTYAYFRASIRYRSAYPAKENQFGIIAETIDSRSGKDYKYNFKKVPQSENFETNKWSNFYSLYIPPYLRSRGDSLLFFIYLIGDKPVIIDQFYVEIYDPTKLNRKYQYFNDFNTIIIGHWSAPSQLVTERQYEKIDSLSSYSSTLSIPITDAVKGKQLTFQLSGLTPQKENNQTFVVVSVKNSNQEDVFYKSYSIDPYTDWSAQEFTFQLPRDFENGQDIKCYLWNDKGGSYLIRWMKVELRESYR